MTVGTVVGATVWGKVLEGKGKESKPFPGRKYHNVWMRGAWAEKKAGEGVREESSVLWGKIAT